VIRKNPERFLISGAAQKRWDVKKCVLAAPVTENALDERGPAGGVYQKSVIGIPASPFNRQEELDALDDRPEGAGRERVPAGSGRSPQRSARM
jgi:hypothetical protein